ncbi:MAG: murein L,D-transpeptidase catalytic domain family protein [Gammaproteobacteria bacterium]|nr:murein L,D-transpeptidase catalytic domain family protein [Gammaproteobacteria bacterium]
MKKSYLILTELILAGLLAAVIYVLISPADNLKEVKQVTARDGLSPRLLAYAINGYRWAVKSDAVSDKAVLTIVDFNRPSNQKRLWVIDLKNDHVLMHIHVAQGKNTGKLIAKHFSNQPGSYESSPGIYTTASVFEGEHGESLHVMGLEKGINSNASSRAIEIHPAWYVTPAFIEDHGYAGRSWGCFAVNPAQADKFIGYVKNGSVLFAYGYPEKHDPHVDHALSKNGELMYTAITGINEEDPVIKFFQSF